MTEAARLTRSRRRGTPAMSRPSWGATVAVAVFIILWLYPLWLSISTSLKSDGALRQDPLGFPLHPTLDAYASAWQVIDMPQLLANSLILAIGGTALSVMFAFPVGYFLARRLIPFSDAVFVFLLIGLMVPQQIVVIPLYNIAASIGLSNSLLGLVIIHGVYGIPFALLVFRGFFSGLPRSLDESARMDGCSDVGVLRRIILPLSGPAIMTVVVLQFINIWNEFFFAVILLNGGNTAPVTVGVIPITQSQYFTSWNLPAAALIMAQLPTIIIYIVAQRWVIGGLTAGAVKG